MKIKIETIHSGEDEMILRCKEETPLIRQLVALAQSSVKKIPVLKEKEQYFITPGEVLYLESVDDNTYLYTASDVYRFQGSLSTFEMLGYSHFFFRCSKSMILNLRHIEHLKSLPGKRIDATLTGGEHVLISRHYADELKERLKGGSSRETN